MILFEEKTKMLIVRREGKEREEKKILILNTDGT